MVTRPTSVTVLAIIGLGLGGLGLCGLPLAFLQLRGPLFGSNPMLEELAKDAGYVRLTAVSLTIGALLLVPLLAGSIGSFSLKPWVQGDACVRVGGGGDGGGAVADHAFLRLAAHDECD